MKNKKENIAEYILYLWQMEDYLRAFPQTAEQNEELHNLLEMMRREGVMGKGHIQLAKNALQEAEELHILLWNEEATYRAAALQIMPSLAVLKSKTDTPAMSDIEACLLLLYQIMLLRLQKRPISAETEAVQQQATKLLQYLSRTYRDRLDQEEP